MPASLEEARAATRTVRRRYAYRAAFPFSQKPSKCYGMRDHIPDLEQELDRLRDQLRNTNDEAVRDEVVDAIRTLAERLANGPLFSTEYARCVNNS